MRESTRREHLAMLTAGVAFGAGARPASAQSVRWSSGTERPSMAVPPNATDCHYHIYDARFPPSPIATLRPQTRASRITGSFSVGSG